MKKLTKREKEAKLVKKYYVESKEELDVIEKGAYYEGYTCFRTTDLCDCKRSLLDHVNVESLFVTIGDLIVMEVMACPKCAARKKAKPFKRFIQASNQQE